MRCGLPTVNRVESPKFRFTSWTAEGAALAFAVRFNLFRPPEELSTSSWLREEVQPFKTLLGSGRVFGI